MKSDIATFSHLQPKYSQPVTANPPNTTNPTEIDEDCQALADSQILLPLHKFLHLLHRFRQNTHSLTAWDTTQQTVHLTAPTTSPPLMDSQNLSVQILVRGQQVSGSIIDGGSGVNVIIEATCSKLDITEWESSPFWLHMDDTCFVCPIGLIRNLEFTLGGHAFTVSIVILRLDAPGSYPFLLG